MLTPSTLGTKTRSSAGVSANATANNIAVVASQVPRRTVMRLSSSGGLTLALARPPPRRVPQYARAVTVECDGLSGLLGSRPVLQAAKHFGDIAQVSF